MDGPSAYENDALPVVGFCFQEPENDPRNFVYVWILRSENDIDSQEEKEHSLSNIALISLYAMAFQNKVSIYIPNVFYGCDTFSPQLTWSPEPFDPNGQMVPVHLVPEDKWSPRQLVPMDKWSPSHLVPVDKWSPN